MRTLSTDTTWSDSEEKEALPRIFCKTNIFFCENNIFIYASFEMHIGGFEISSILG